MDVTITIHLTASGLLDIYRRLSGDVEEAAAVDQAGCSAPETPAAGASGDDAGPKRRSPRARKPQGVTDEELLAQARDIAEGGTGSNGASAAVAVTDQVVKANVTPPPDQAPAAATPPDPAPEADANEPPHHPDTGEVIRPIAPDAPELAALREGLRAIGYSATPKALEYLTNRLRRPIGRLGELTPGEVRMVLTEIEGVKQTLRGSTTTAAVPAVAATGSAA